MKEVNITLVGNIPGIISVMDNRLLMIHTDFLSEQFPLNDIGVSLQKHPENNRLAIMHKDTETHQSLYLKKGGEEEIVKFFLLLGFPMPESP